MKMFFYSTAAVILILFCAIPCRVFAAPKLSLKADSSKKCAICHYKWVSTFFLEHKSTPIAHAGEKSLEMFSRELCISCHDGSIRDSRSKIFEDPGHQVGRIPSKEISIPPGFPLDEKGALKCTTCHTPHAVSEDSQSMVEYFLRAPNENSSLCRTCHKQKLGGLAKGNHPVDVSVKANVDIIKRGGGKFGAQQTNQIICETCHKAHGGVNSRRLVLPVESTRSMSVLCEVCHTKNALKPGKSTEKTLSHPVDIRPEKGVNVPSVWSNGEKVYIGHSGEIVCRTCHKPHQADRQFLLVTQDGKDKLCVQCHVNNVYVSGISTDPEGSVPSGINITGKDASNNIAPCSSCHLAHNADAAFLKAREVLTGSPEKERVFRVPHFGLHLRAFFSSVFFKKDGGKEDGIFLFTDNGNPSDNGTIVCATCHNIPMTGSDEMESINSADSDNSTDGFLRTGIAEKFCKSCHGEEALMRFLYFHKKW